MSGKAVKTAVDEYFCSAILKHLFHAKSKKSMEKTGKNTHVTFTKLQMFIFCKYGYIASKSVFQVYFKINEELFMLILLYFIKSFKNTMKSNFYKCKMYKKGEI